MTKTVFTPAALVVVLLLAAYGCSPNDSAVPPATPAPAEEVANNAVHEDHPGHDASSGEVTKKTDMEKMNETLASFSEEDRASVIKQHICPVSGEMLGTMGAPKKVDVDGQAVWICCDGCKDKLLAEPDKYLAKLAE